VLGWRGGGGFGGCASVGGLGCGLGGRRGFRGFATAEEGVVGFG